VSLIELFGIAIGCTLLALGVTSTGTWGLRRRRQERLLLLFGVWCLLYGARVLGDQPAVRLAIGGSTRAWQFVDAFITYLINVPTALFFEALVGPGWHRTVRRVREVTVAYAAVAVSAGVVTGSPYAAMPFNDPIVLAGLAVQTVNVWLSRHRLSRVFASPGVFTGAGVLAATVINQNVGRPLLPAVNLEPVGVLVFVCALGHGIIRTVVRGEAELGAVQRELEMATDIMRSLLPRAVPTIRGLDVAVQFAPMTAVGGDLYDFVDLGSGKVGVVVADVSGHGVPAALVATMVKFAFSSASEHADDPARMLAAINRALCPHLERGFVTAVYAVLDIERSTMTVANAGHPPVLVGSRTRGLRRVDEHGLVLGFMPGAAYVNAEIALADGDTVLFYTDGVIEAQNAHGDFFDGDRVGRWLTTAGDASAERLRDAAVAELDRWRGQLPIGDDITFVLARFATGTAEPT
jgi:phosphoserine phosphatase RsbU/P